MPEGVAESGGGVVDAGVAEGGRRPRPPRPPDDPEKAPKGWTFDTKLWDWRPSLRVTRREPGATEGSSSEPRHAARSTLRDPDPARMLPDAAGGGGPSPGAPRPADGAHPDGRTSKLSDEELDDLHAVLALAGSILLQPVAGADPICGGAALENWDHISEKLVPIVAKSKKVSDWATKGGGLLDWLGLASALSPVGRAIVSHHVFHTAELPDRGEETTEDFSAYVA